MANTIQIRRGLNAALPTLAAGELGFSTDTKQVYIGDGTANYEFLTQQVFTAKGDILSASADNTPAILTVGTNGQVLSANSAQASGLEWIAAAAAGANTALSNLASVALNTALLPDVAAADDFGSATLPFKDLWFAGSSGTPGTNNFQITGASTSGTRVITFPDSTGTVLNDSSVIDGGAYA